MCCAFFHFGQGAFSQKLAVFPRVLSEARALQCFVEFCVPCVLSEASQSQACEVLFFSEFASMGNSTAAAKECQHNSVLLEDRKSVV